MFSYIKGKITIIKSDYVTVETGNIGYIIKTPYPFSFELEEELTMYTHVIIREDSFDIYGFKEEKERNFFLKLLSVKGIGPKGAMAIIASESVGKVIEAINSGNASFLQRFPGIGQKASQQIILDLHGKIDLNGSTTLRDNPKIANIKEALKAMGYGTNEIKKVIPVISENIDLSLQELIKLALKKIV